MSERSLTRGMRLAGVTATRVTARGGACWEDSWGDREHPALPRSIATQIQGSVRRLITLYQYHNRIKSPPRNGLPPHAPTCTFGNDFSRLPITAPITRPAEAFRPNRLQPNTNLASANSSVRPVRSRFRAPDPCRPLEEFRHPTRYPAVARREGGGGKAVSV